VSDTLNNPEQLNLSFEDEARASSAKIFSFADHRQRAQPEKSSTVETSADEISKEREREILDEVIKQAEQLPWYK